MTTKIHFIVNPVAGTGRNNLTKAYLDKYFGNGFYDIKIKISNYAKHAIELTKESIDEKANIIVACGGDGTINEVASCLVGTKVILGILPMGSGNGLASNLKIPRRLSKAIKIIKNYHVIKIDAGKVNNELFFSNTGIGFDAYVISDFEGSPKRKFWSYLSSVIRTLKTYNYSNTFEVYFNNKTQLLKPFLLFISNSNEMGYKMSLTPKASLQDGVFDVIVVPKLSYLKMILFVFLFLIKKHHWLNDVLLAKTNYLLLKKEGDHSFKAQKDGECINLNSDSIEIKLLPKTLNVCVA